MRAKVRASFEKAFANWKAGGDVDVRVSAGAAVQVHDDLSRRQTQGRAERVSRSAFQARSRDTPDYFAIAVMNNILGQAALQCGSTVDPAPDMHAALTELIGVSELSSFLASRRE